MADQVASGTNKAVPDEKTSANTDRSISPTTRVPLQNPKNVAEPTSGVVQTVQYHETGSLFNQHPVLDEVSDSATKVAEGARSGAELLRRLSFVDNSTAESAPLDPKQQYPDLKLTGNIISASICVPYQFEHCQNGEWKISARHGTSALFDSFAYLASDRSPWNHTLIGWTGEIQPASSASHNSTTGEDGSATFQIEPENLRSSHKSRPRVTSYKSGAFQAANESAPTHVYNPVTDTIVIPEKDRASLETKLMNHSKGKTLPVWLGDGCEDGDTNLYLKDQSRWRRYAEHELYTLFHYRQHPPDNGRAEQKSWADYVQMNAAFAERILRIYKAGDIIWIHDYHLMLLPSMLRQRVSNAYIGFFLHIPFPSSEYLRCLPRRKDVLTGALGATMIGFQSYSFSRHFNSCCKRILGFESSSAGVDAYGAHVSVDVFPIGIDVGAVQKAAFGNPTIEDNVSALKQLYAGKKMIVGRDRLDTVRGVAQKLMAFELFLDRYPQWREKAVLIQVTSPTSIEEEKEDPSHRTETKISSLVSRINGEFGSLSHSPVQHYPQYLNSTEYFALLRAADVGLITSVRDGMNTTSLEYIVCQRDNHGPLILSEFSGTAASLGNAMHINPWDIGGVAASIKEALEMPERKKAEDHERLFNYVSTHTVSHWSDNFVKRLLTNLTSFSQSELTPALDVERLKFQYAKAKKRLFMFDYDGTLTPIVKDPHAAIPSDRVLRTLKALASDPKNEVWIISGRDEKFLGEWMGSITELGLSAEHGCFIQPPNSDEWENLTTRMDMSWQKEVMEVFSYYTERTQGSWVERKRVALTWHYRQADPDFGAWQARECRKVLEDGPAKKWEVEVMSGKANLEVRPKFVNKGYIADRLVHERGYGTSDPPDFILCMGDDQTDEDMFRALLKTELPEDEVFSCTVGASSKRTAAKWHVLAPADVLNALGELTKPFVPRRESIIKPSI